jgi:S1-C subfamily serine protease
MLRSGLLLFATAFLGSTSLPVMPDAPITPTPYLIDNNIVPKIDCGKWMGTGVYVGDGLVATARHVVAEGPCLVDGARAKVVGGVRHRDFVLLKVKTVVAYRALLDCSGIHEGQAYLATGFAEDAPRTVTQRLTGSSAKSTEKGFEGETVMRGSITQGMSGGPVVDASTGALVAIINANSGDGVTQSLVFPISETPLCRR